MKKYSEIKFIEAIETVLQNYNPVKIYYNNKIVWDDDLMLNKGWIPVERAIEKFQSTYPNWEKIVISSIKINIVQFHHSVVRLKGKIEKEN